MGAAGVENGSAAGVEDEYGALGDGVVAHRTFQLHPFAGGAEGGGADATMHLDGLTGAHEGIEITMDGHGGHAEPAHKIINRQHFGFLKPIEDLFLAGAGNIGHGQIAHLLI